jgi:hypothetical protein
MVGSCGFDSYGSGQGPVVGSCEHSNDLRIPWKEVNFLTRATISVSRRRRRTRHVTRMRWQRWSLVSVWEPQREDVCWCGGIALSILNLGNRWRWVVSFRPQGLYPLENTSSVGKGLVGFENRTGHGAGNRAPVVALGLVIILTSVSLSFS